MGLTAGQEQAVESRHKPLFIQAGAGTGKTFTLTKRISKLLDSGDVRGVDNLLVITFTKKAAGELLGRIRDELRANNLALDALKVDAAWISTIHSMCERIIRSQAFDAGIDPFAGQLGDAETDWLMGCALDQVLANGDYELELSILKESSKSIEDIRKLIVRCLNILKRLPDIEAGLDFGPAPRALPSEVLRQALELVEGTLGKLRGIDFASSSATAAKIMDRLEDACRVYTCALDESSLDKGCPATEEIVPSKSTGMASGLAWSRLDGLLNELCSISVGRIKKEPARTILDEFRHRADLMHAQAQSAACYWQARCYMSLAVHTAELHRGYKRRRGMLDMEDILAECHRLLASDLELSASYREHFDSVMVDEFQDTDALQVAIIEKLVDPGLSTLVTVGDAQQSIYGFRGADLEVYYSCRDKMRGLGCDDVSLDTNFRSHPDILSFVEAVFSSPSYFGENFLRVVPGPDNARSVPWLDEDAPRVRLALAAGAKDASGFCPSIDELRAAEAELIAEKFARLHADGAAFGQMAILLRNMKKAHLYLDALREHGIPYVVSGGSSFLKGNDVGLIVSLLRFLADPDDDEPLLNLIASELFDVSDDDLLALAALRAAAARPVGHRIKRKVSLFDALCLLDDSRLEIADDAAAAKDADAGECTLLHYARLVLEQALSHVGALPLSAVVLEAIEGAGLIEGLRRQGVSGAARRATIARLCDLIDEHEHTFGRSVVKAALYFSNLRKLALDGIVSGEKPATLATTAGSAVEIMTFHSSKGLEFPIVALAEYDSPRRATTDIVALSEGQTPHVALVKSSAAKDFACIEDTPSFDEASDSASYAAHAAALKRQREDEEAQRLLYVAMTRARDLLIVIGHDKGYLSKGELAGGAFSSLVMTAFDGHMPEAGCASVARTGATVSFDVFEATCLDAADDISSEAGEPADAGRFHCMVPQSRRGRVKAHVDRLPELFSYSSIAEPFGSPLDETPDEAPIEPIPEPAPEPTPEPIPEPATSFAAEDDPYAFGSAFHALAQWIAAQASIDIDDKVLHARIEAFSRRYSLKCAGQKRLDELAREWIGSSLFARTRSYPVVHAEHPFLVTLGERSLEGYLDLLCLDPGHRCALIVDYKTGIVHGSADLRGRYALQAQCYAYAVLACELAESVELVFVRVEEGMAEISFSYTADDLDVLAETILGASRQT